MRVKRNSSPALSDSPSGSDEEGALRRLFCFSLCLKAYSAMEFPVFLSTSRFPVSTKFSSFVLFRPVDFGICGRRGRIDDQAEE